MTEFSDPAFPVLVDRKGPLCVIRMNRPKALNALNLELIEALTEAIKEAVVDDTVRSIWLESTTEKAFCAGGDIKALHRALSGSDATAQREAGYRYFLAEYRLDALIEHCPKPIVAWGDGLVMGGGWGLLAGADVRLVSERSRLAMPELKIGLFPDVGAAHFLQQPDWRIGTVIGLAGLNLTGEQAVALGYADAMPTQADVQALQRHLIDGQSPTTWSPPEHTSVMTTVRKDWQSAVDALPEPNLSDWMAHIQAADFGPFREATEHWKTGSPLTIALTWVHFRRLRDTTRVAALTEDLIVGANACSEREFAEGVRALLVDKDKQPAWLYPNVESVPYSLIERFYRPLPFDVASIGPEFE